MAASTTRPRAIAEPLEPRRLLAAVLPNGGAVDGEISIRGEQDVYEFTAAAGETLLLGIRELGSNTNLNPRVIVSAPDGAELANVVTSYASDLDLVAPQSGTYSLAVRDDDSFETGDYRLSLLRLPPLGATRVPDTDDGDRVLPNGGVLDGLIDSNGTDFDVYTFTATAGDKLLLGVRELGSNTNLNPRVQVFGPGGTQLADLTTSYAADYDLAAPHGGTYSLVVRDDDGFETGDYQLSLLRLPPLSAQRVADTDDGDRVLANGGTLDGQVDSNGTDFDVYTFDADAGEGLLLGVRELGSNTNLNPRVTIFAPDGTELADLTTSYAADYDLAAPQNGTYSLVVRDDDGFETGDYRLSLLRLPPLGATRVADADDGDRALINGEVLNGLIDSNGTDFDVYTFDADPGEQLLLGVRELGNNTNLNPRVTVFAPDGTQLADLTTSYAAAYDLTTPQGGTYSFVVRDDDGFETGDYAISVARAPANLADIDGRLIANGEQVLGSSGIIDFDIYAFEAEAGDNIIAAAGETAGSNSTDIQLRIYGPDGRFLGGEADDFGLDLDLFAPQTGTYYAVVNELGGDGAIDYTLTVAAFPGSLPVDPFDVDSGPLVSGQVRGGSIRLADLDVFTFQSGFGDSFTVAVNETFDPTGNNGIRIDVYDPDGEFLGGQDDATAATVTVNSAPAFGTYFAVVRDVNSNASIGYTIGLNATPGSDTFAPVVAGTRAIFEPTQAVEFVLSERAAGLSFRDFTLTNLTTGEVFAPTLDFNDLTNVARLTFPNLADARLPDGRYRVELEAGSFTDLFGNPFGNARFFEFVVLAGDANRDGQVSIADFAILRSNFGGAGLFSEGDFNYDGQVTIADFAILRGNFGVNLGPVGSLFADGGEGDEVL